jgi:hypothetical protein
MSLPVILPPRADADIQATHDELERVQAGLGSRFVARPNLVSESQVRRGREKWLNLL